MTKTILNFVTFAIFADLFILCMALAQVAVEGRTGYWSGWWMWQAKIVLNLIS